MASSARRQPLGGEAKKERIELRIAPSAKQLIHRAMAVTGLTAGDLAYEGARRVLDASRNVAVFAIVVDAKDDAATAFYAGFGFTPFPSRPRRLFMLVSTAASALVKASQ